MNDTKFTRAPWTVGKADPSVSYASDVHLPAGWQMITGRYPPFAFGCCVAHVAETADAHLIAAAPDLYAALVRCLEWVEADETVHGRTFGCGNDARAALAKARGEE